MFAACRGESLSFHRFPAIEYRRFIFIHAPEAAEVSGRFQILLPVTLCPEQVYFVCYDEEAARLYADYLLSKATTLPDKTRTGVPLNRYARAIPEVRHSRAGY